MKAVVGSSQVALTWSSVSGATAYNVYRGLSSGTLVLYQFGNTTTTYTDTSVSPSTPYYYQVAATASGSEGALSTPAVEATPGGTVLGAPTGLTAVAGTSSVNLYWNGVSGATSYNIYRGSTSGGEGVVPLVVNDTSASYQDNTAVYGSTYYYVVTAVNAVGESPASSEVSATPGSIALAAPTLKAIAGSTQISLYWTAVSGASSYVLYRSVYSGSYTTYQTGLTSTSYTDTAVSSPNVYTYYIDALGEGTASSPPVSATPGGTALGATLLTADEQSGGPSWRVGDGTFTLNLWH